jgi:hypothetical protein
MTTYGMEVLDDKNDKANFRDRLKRLKEMLR